MTSATVRRVFEVEAPLEEAWQRLAEVERWPEWAPHITSVTVSPPGELGPTSSGCPAHQAAGAQHLPHVGLGAARALGVGRRAGWGPHLLRPSVRVGGSAATRLEWLVELHGPLAPLIRPVFARVYGRNLDQAIPRLQEWFRH